MNDLQPGQITPHTDGPPVSKWLFEPEEIGGATGILAELERVKAQNKRLVEGLERAAGWLREAGWNGHAASLFNLVAEIAGE